VNARMNTGSAPAEHTRRDFLRAGLLGAGALSLPGLLSACSNTSDNRLVFFNWQDYIGPNLLSDFTAATQIVPSYSTYVSNDELADRLALAGVRRRGNRKRTSFDLIVPSDNLFRRLRGQDRLQPLDGKVVTAAALGALGKQFQALDFDPGNRFSVPWATGSTGIGYDSSVFPEPPTWEVFLDTSHAGKLSLLDETREAFAAALFSLGEDPNTTDPAVITKAAERLTAMKANTAFDSGTYLNGLATGRLVAAQAFSTDVAQAAIKNPKLAFVVPEAGGIRWIDVMCIPKDAPNPEAANRFIAFYLDPKVSAANANALRVDTGNDAAREFVPAEVLADTSAYPDAATQERLVSLRELGDSVTDLYGAAWERLR
jgi:spermidine/putrescine-binding protein